MNSVMEEKIDNFVAGVFNLYASREATNIRINIILETAVNIIIAIVICIKLPWILISTLLII